MFDNLPAISTIQRLSALVDELDRYLQEPTEAAPNPLLWWKENQFRYPHLSRMARNYLCIPGKS